MPTLLNNNISCRTSYYRYSRYFLPITTTFIIIILSNLGYVSATNINSHKSQQPIHPAQQPVGVIGRARRLSDEFLPVGLGFKGYCREQEYSNPQHTRERCATPAECSDPSVESACKAQGLFRNTDHMMLLEKGNGCRKVFKGISIARGKSPNIRTKQMEFACIPLRHYCGMKTGRFECWELEGCEWIYDQDAPWGGQFAYYPVPGYKSQGEELALPKIECQVPEAQRVKERLPCNIQKEFKGVRKGGLRYTFITSKIGQQVMDPRDRYKLLRGKEINHNVPRNDCARCKEIGAPCDEANSCCSGKCVGSLSKHTPCTPFTPCYCSPLEPGEEKPADTSSEEESEENMLAEAELAQKESI